MEQKVVKYPMVRVGALCAVAALAVASACSSRVSSDLTAPRPSVGVALDKSASLDAPNARHAMWAPGSPSPRYPAQLKADNVAGQVVVAVVVDSTGMMLPGSMKVISSTNQLFTDAVAEALPKMRWLPAVVNGRNVREMLTLPFVFNIADGANTAYQMTSRTTVITGVKPAP